MRRAAHLGLGRVRRWKFFDPNRFPSDSTVRFENAAWSLASETNDVIRSGHRCHFMMKRVSCDKFFNFSRDRASSPAAAERQKFNSNYQNYQNYQKLNYLRRAALAMTNFAKFAI